MPAIVALPSVDAMTIRLGAAAALLSLGLSAAPAVPSAADTAAPIDVTAPAVSVAETAARATVKVKLAKPARRTTRIRWRTLAGTATPGADYRAAKGTVTIRKGARKGKVTVAILNDTRPEPDETFTVRFKPAHGRAASATVTIRANDGGAGSAGGKGSGYGTLRIPRTITGTFSGQKGPAYDMTMTWNGTLTYVYDPTWDGRDHPEWKLQSATLNWSYHNAFNNCTGSGVVAMSGFTSSSGARILYGTYHDGAPYDYVLGADLTGTAKLLPITCDGDPTEYHQELYLDSGRQSTPSLLSYSGSRSEPANTRTESWNFTGSDPFDWKIAFAAP
jgi:hypothetical protein